MIEVKHTDDYLHVKASGKATHKDYVNTLIPSLEKEIADADSHKINVLMEVADFHGWEIKAGWDDFKTGIKHRKNFNKVALVGDKKWEKVVSKFFSFFISAEVKYFDISQKDEAINWLK